MTTVTSILKYLEMNSQDYSMDQNMDMHPRPKKRRLDHLTWEEKMQRKKLKNRVAAQTSRDRKKAKMEQMEHALQQLFSKNESVQAECEALKATNQRLVQENVDLLARLQSPCEKCLQNDKQSRASAEDRSELPSLQDLLDELDVDVDIDSLEQLAHGLLQNVAKDLEEAAQEADRQASSDFGQMVGQTPAKLEPHGHALLNKEEEEGESSETDFSEYLLLHHNYAAKPPASPKKHKKTKKFKPIRPKTNISDTKNIVTIYVNDNTACVETTPDVNCRLSEPQNVKICEATSSVTCCSPKPQNAMICESTSSVTCCSPAPQNAMICEDTSPINCHLTVPQNVICLSPMSCSSSDHGYESIGSPSSIEEDIWDESISELFPSLI
ncbi:unnamed protein product [Phaedon cochleariae]|uniref:X-box-binding protein 1 n=1 Tax=Phaedon cochleariae TaxID=80249 RepID=A0A9P0DL30_PHACE|nr:unnamed protein product [Phaedon cochleariae]